MQQLHTLQEIALGEEQQKRFDKIYRVIDKSEYLPQVLLFLPIPLLLVIISFLTKRNIPTNTLSLLWLILYCNGFIFLALFFRNMGKVSDKRKVLPEEYSIFSCEGKLLPSQLSSTFLYIDEGLGKVPLALYHSGKVTWDQYGKAIVIEHKPNEFTLFEFLTDGNGSSLTQINYHEIKSEGDINGYR